MQHLWIGGESETGADRPRESASRREELSMHSMRQKVHFEGHTRHARKVTAFDGIESEASVPGVQETVREKVVLENAHDHTHGQQAVHL